MANMVAVSYDADDISYFEGTMHLFKIPSGTSTGTYHTICQHLQIYQLVRDVATDIRRRQNSSGTDASTKREVHPKHRRCVLVAITAVRAKSAVHVPVPVYE